jgi:hypothetical protein
MSPEYAGMGKEYKVHKGFDPDTMHVAACTCLPPTDIREEVARYI